MNASNVILACMGVTTVMVVVGDLSENHVDPTTGTIAKFPASTIAAGAMATTIILELIAEVEPNIATAFAMLIMTAAIVSPKSAPLIRVVNKLVVKKSAIPPEVSIPNGGNAKIS